MRRILIIVAVVALALAGGLWLVLIAMSPEKITAICEPWTQILILAGGIAALCGLTVVLFGDLDCLRFYGAVSAVVALLALAAFYSVRTSSRHELPAKVSLLAEEPAPCTPKREAER